MKLTAKSSIYYLIYTLFIFTIGTVLFYFLIRNVLFNAIDEALHQEKDQVIENLRYEKEFKEIQNSDFIEIIQVGKDSKVYDRFYTISIYNSKRKENIDYRELKSVYKHGDNFYEITIRQPLSEAESLINSILPIEVALFFGLIVGVLLINRFISNKIWQPFYDLVERLKNYDLVNIKIIPYYKSNVDEFDELSESVEKMTTRIYKDFNSQKEFNENSSHELQTPLAIIRNKLELLIQSKNLKDEDMVLIESVFYTINRLTQLNKGLILLSKIENNQYSELTRINIGQLLETLLISFEELINERNIIVQLNILKVIIIPANQILIETLFFNLISNAIKHNIEDAGTITITLSKDMLEISNTGNELPVEAERMFERFLKSSTSEMSVGLGLSIVKKICDLYKFKISYTCVNKIHTTRIEFSPPA
ncbi:sensor histidine kinase [Cytophaga hutchinsonii]|uniref:histidine kinase n=1 Tax=Cytophaga hutchinsonii (strain ATCC 33406 / DSM 1761 / CIP 103989 / NBRC 15051 / NCIMB 9469 / D465) TaxID=269798 RepID=A0A6N4SUI7_CYTH3|nr:HAMP domain-containing sensor histidine kinase [Cytophaga hutchinsonii]ABG59981.1 twp-component sensor histidine kinase [Cytophaga hutchinsonii ATCC 33406]SFX26299.1 Signal transduction histidine kinase [Cytophaga hutchinsonii ATCC 33406]